MTIKAMLKKYFFSSSPQDEGIAIAGPSNKIPSPLREEMSNLFAQQDSEIYLLTACDPSKDIFALYNGTEEAYFKASDAQKLVLVVAGPAKGSGYIYLCWADESGLSYPCIISSSYYSQEMHQWLREYTIQLSRLLRCPWEEPPMGADA